MCLGEVPVSGFLLPVLPSAFLILVELGFYSSPVLQHCQKSVYVPVSGGPAISLLGSGQKVVALNVVCAMSCFLSVLEENKPRSFNRLSWEKQCCVLFWDQNENQSTFPLQSRRPHHVLPTGRQIFSSAPNFVYMVGKWSRKIKGGGKDLDHRNQSGDFLGRGVTPSTDCIGIREDYCPSHC